MTHSEAAIAAYPNDWGDDPADDSMLTNGEVLERVLTAFDAGRASLSPVTVETEALRALEELFNAARPTWHSGVCRADLDAAMQKLSDERGRFLFRPDTERGEQ